MGTRFDTMMAATARKDATPGALILVGVRSMIIRLTVIALFATMFCYATNSMGGTTFGIERSASRFMSLNPLVYAALAAVTIWAVSRAVRNSYTEEQSLKLFDRVVTWTLVALAVLVIATQVLFAMGSNEFFASYDTMQGTVSKKIFILVGQIDVYSMTTGTRTAN